MAALLALAVGSFLCASGSPCARAEARAAGATAVHGPHNGEQDGRRRFELPVQAPVVDRFRPPRSEWGAGNRGWEFDTRGGEAVRAVGAGVVTFAGFVAGRHVVSIDHGAGLVSSVTGLRSVDVARGERVAAGDLLGTAMAALHLGFRSKGRYVDPAQFYERPVHAVLVPLPERGGG
ncbi:MAG: M23 family metallopeptidase [Microthrixaceae bacterium]